jgi:hypothetical protein
MQSGVQVNGLRVWPGEVDIIRYQSLFASIPVKSLGKGTVEDGLRDPGENNLTDLWLYDYDKPLLHEHTRLLPVFKAGVCVAVAAFPLSSGRAAQENANEQGGIFRLL